MEPAVLKKVLVNQLDAEEDGGLYRLPDNSSVSLLIEAEEGIIPVSELEEIEFTDDYVIVTAEEERLYVDEDTFFALRQDDLEERHPEKRPGFH
jgi:hypothetical protein